MWKLKIAEDGPLLSTVSNHVGRQHWEFDPDAGTPEERAEIERLRLEFTKNRFKLTKENPCGSIPAAVKLNDKQVVTEEAVTITLRRALMVWYRDSGRYYLAVAAPSASTFHQISVEELTGAYMRNCTLNYSSYRNIYPIWALGQYRRHVLLA
ncbi:Terpenoid cyclases/protein prenyltransferase alpha-alpha toroid [Corchorus capsularis]|uniref:Terpenoid cyclases/protein prenyltransferase alpha-alpha toroid n=1 Tax=Corchorus capsularis TaxID=210143 RepID=A0A1R3IE57_COCAP|nr:Terpenoid cyclases/protein prenyltransferase alpha-alpha toroid [Corchorus capsularis]